MPALDDTQIAGLASKCWKGNNRVIGTAVALAESSGDPTAGNSCCHGLWQINTNAHRQYTIAEMQDPVKNIKAACAIFHSQGWAAWESYTNGSYKQYLPRARRAVSVVSNEALQEPEGVQHNLEEGYNGAKKAVEGAISWTAELGKILSFLSSSSGWVRVGKVALGGALLFIAVDEVLKSAPSAPSPGPIRSGPVGTKAASVTRSAGSAAKDPIVNVAKTAAKLVK